jgi:hypothetical protein
MLKHLTHNINPLIKLSFNTPKSTRDLDALSTTFMLVVFILQAVSRWLTKPMIIN